jgi:hypothetical protein
VTAVRDSEEAVLDFDGWLGRQDPQARAGVEEHLRMVPDATRDVEKKRLASMFAVADATKLDLGTVNDRWDTVRGGFAEKQGKDWLAVKDDEAGFYDRLKTHVTKQRDERHLLAGLDDEKAPGAKEAWEKSLIWRAQEAAYKGGTYADALSEWQNEVKGKNGYDPERVSAYAEAARRTHESMAASVAKVRPIADKVYTSLAQSRDLQGGEPAGDPAALMRGLSPEEKNLAFRMVGDLSGKGDKGRGEAAGEAIFRSFENTALGGGAQNFRSQLLGRTFKEGDQVTEPGAVAQIQRQMGLASASGSGAAAASLAESFRPTRKLTAEEAAKWNQDVGAAIEDLDTSEQARKFAQNVVDPAKAGGWFFQKAVLPMADSTALLASMSMPAAWVPAMQLSAKSYQNDEYARLRSEGMDTRQANKIAAVTGLAQAALDKAETSLFIKGIPGVGKALERFALGGRVGTRFAANFAGTVAAETAIELVQDHIIPAAVQDNLATDSQFDVHWADVWAETAKEAPETALGMVLLSALGGALQTREQSTVARELSSSKAAMRLRGYSIEQINEIQAAPEADRGALLAQYLPAKAPTGEAQTQLVAEVKELAKAEQAAFAEKAKADAASASEAADYTVRVVRDAGGWKVHKGDGSVIEVNSADAAVKIRDDLKQASTQAEASALVAIIDTWHEKAGSEDRQTTLTGETARSDGGGITYTRDGEVTREIKDSAALDTLRKEAQMDAKLSGNEEIDVIVNGSNTIEFREKVGEGARDVIQRLELNLSESSALTALHEQAEAAWRTGIARGSITLEETQRGIAAVAGALDPAQARDESEREFRERVQRVARGEGSETDVRETVSELAVADAIGRRKDGGAMPAGAVTTALDAAIRNATDAGEARTLGKLRAFIRAAKQYFRGVLGTVAAIKKAKRGDGAADFESLMSKVLGFDEQARHDAKLSSELADTIPDYVPPTPEEEAAGIAFSIGKVGAIGYVDSYGAVHARPINTEEELGRLEHADLFGHAVVGADRWRYDRLGGIEWTRTPSDDSKEALENWLARKGVGIAFSLSKAYGELVKKTGFPAVSIGHLAKEAELPVDEVKKEVVRAWLKGDAVLSGGDWSLSDETTRAGAVEVQGDRMLQVRWLDPSFRLSPGKRLELIQKRIDAALSRDPEQRRSLAKRAMDKVQKLQFEWETERQTPRGDVIRPVEEKRRKAELDKEQAVRQVLREAELIEEGMSKLSASEQAAYGNGLQRLAESPLVGTMLGSHGKLVSRTRAEKEGKQSEYDDVPWLPPQWYAKKGGLMPDEMAQALANDGLLKDGYPDTLWTALASEIQTIRNNNAAWEKASAKVKAIEEQAKAQAKSEGIIWRNEEDKKQREDWNPKTRLVRDLRTLDAILSVLPAELRGKVGGFVKLATLSSDEARAKEINRRIDKLAGLVEKHLQAETTAALDELQKKAEPDREAGKASRGKIGAEAHRYFDQIEAVRDLTEEQVNAARAGIADAYNSPDLTAEQAADLFEREQILDTFGAWEKKSAADMDAALMAAQSVYETGRNERRIIEEARLAEVADKAAQIVEALGSGYKGIQDQKQAAKSVRSKLGNAVLDLKSFGEVLEALLGREHHLAKEWAAKAREGIAQRNDEIRELRKRWKDAIETATRKKGVAARRALWDMGQDQTITVEKPGEATGGKVSVPIDIIDKWKDGTANPDALGLTADEADALISDRDSMAPDDRRQSLEIDKATRGPNESVPMTEAEGIFLTMLGAQDQYAAALDRAGWTADTLAEIEGKLSAAAKSLREFMRTEYREGYGPLAAVFEQMYGVALPQIRNYAPAAFYHQGAERTTGPDESANMEGGMRAGFLKNRKQHAAAPRLENAFATFFGHANQTAHWKGLAEFVREFSGVIGRPEVKKAILAAHGEHMLKTLNDWTRNIEGNGLQKSSGQLDGFVRWLVGAQAHIALAFRLGTLLKQSSAVLGSAYKMPLGEYARGFAKLISGRLDVSKVYKSPVIQRRLESGFAPEVRAAMNDIWTAKPTRRAAILQAGMEFIGLTDAIFTTGSAAIAYDYHLREGLAAGMTQAAAETTAMREVEDIVSRTAQPADVVDRSLFEARQGQFGRLLFMYASEARQKSSLVLTAWQNTLTGKATKADVRVLIVSHLIAGPMLQAITAAWRDARDDDDSEWLDAEHWKPRDFAAAVVAGPLSGIPLIGDALSGFGNDGVFSRYAKAGKSGWQIAQELFGEEKAKENPEKVEWYVKHVSKVLQGLDGFTGVVGSVVEQVFSIADNLLPDSEDEAARKERLQIQRERKKEREE